MREQRPRFHVTPTTGWLNDPNGPFRHDGRTHLFYQHNPRAPAWAPGISWGHASSVDLVTWREEPRALEPSGTGPDALGCWSGCVVDDDGVPTAVYSGLADDTAFGAETVCLARAEDGLRTWRKDPRNPVLEPPAGLTAWRDPFVWREPAGWAMVLGAGLGDDAAVLLYRSPDLLDWTHEGVLLRGPGAGVWECPQLFPLRDRHVLLVSVWDEDPAARHALGFVGTLAHGRYEPERAERLDHGPDLYAPATMEDGSGRRLLWGWAPEARDETAAGEQGWAGALTFPRALDLDGEGRLFAAPASELAALRGALETISDYQLGAVVPTTRGDALELEASLAPGDGAIVRIGVHVDPAGREETALEWEPATGRVVLDRTRSSLDARALGGRYEGRVEPGAELELRMLVDRSVLEVFANGRLTLTARVYPTLPESTGVLVRATSGEARLRVLRLWTLRAAA